MKRSLLIGQVILVIGLIAPFFAPSEVLAAPPRTQISPFPSPLLAQLDALDDEDEEDEDDNDPAPVSMPRWRYSSPPPTLHRHGSHIHRPRHAKSHLQRTKTARSVHRVKGRPHTARTHRHRGYRHATSRRTAHATRRMHRADLAQRPHRRIKSHQPTTYASKVHRRAAAPHPRAASAKTSRSHARRPTVHPRRRGTHRHASHPASRHISHYRRGSHKRAVGTHQAQGRSRPDAFASRHRHRGNASPARKQRSTSRASSQPSRPHMRYRVRSEQAAIARKPAHATRRQHTAGQSRNRSPSTRPARTHG